ncbi:MAG: autotransporter-associated beta strand repeat-containing protein [Planctomycetota bacterium]
MLLTACCTCSSDRAKASALGNHGAVAVRSLRGEYDGEQSARAEGDPVSVEMGGIATGNTFQSSSAWASANAAADRFLQVSAIAKGVGAGPFVPAGQAQGVAVWRDIATTDVSTKPKALRFTFTLSSFLKATAYPDAVGDSVSNNASIGVEWQTGPDSRWWNYDGGLYSEYAYIQAIADSPAGFESPALTTIERYVADQWRRWDSYSFAPVPDGAKYLFEGTFHIDVPYSDQYGGYGWGLALSAYSHAKGGEAAVFPTGQDGPAGVRLQSVSNLEIGSPLRVYFDSGRLPMDVPGFVAFDVPAGIQTQEQAGYSLLTPLIATSVTKTGLGTLVFDAANTYTVPTAIEQGTLAITNSAALSRSSLVSLASGAGFDVSGLAGGYTVPSGQAIAGSGTVLGSVTFGAGSTLSPGASSSPWGTSLVSSSEHLGSLQALVVPEPSTLGLVSVGLCFIRLGTLRRKREA